jgi:hypothetical protein
MAEVCDFSGVDNSICGSSEHYINGSLITSLVNCDKDTFAHLRSLNSSEDVVVPECLLILYRTGVFCVTEQTLKLNICQKHRDQFGIYWKRTSIKCTAPDHPVFSKAKADRGASPSLCKGYWSRSREAIPVGAGK